MCEEIGGETRGGRQEEEGGKEGWKEGTWERGVGRGSYTWRQRLFGSWLRFYSAYLFPHENHFPKSPLFDALYTAVLYLHSYQVQKTHTNNANN